MVNNDRTRPINKDPMIPIDRVTRPPGMIPGIVDRNRMIEGPPDHPAMDIVGPCPVMSCNHRLMVAYHGYLSMGGHHMLHPCCRSGTMGSIDP